MDYRRRPYSMSGLVVGCWALKCANTASCASTQKQGTHGIARLIPRGMSTPACAVKSHVPYSSILHRVRPWAARCVPPCDELGLRKMGW